MAFVLHIPEAGNSKALPGIYAVHDPQRGIGVIGESLSYADKAGKQRVATLAPALRFCSQISESLVHPEGNMDVAFRIAHERACNDKKRGLQHVVVGAAAMAVQGSLHWGAIGDAGVAIINREDAGITYMTVRTDEQLGADYVDNIAAINGDREMIGREQIGSMQVNPLRQQVVVFSALCRQLLEDEDTRKLLLEGRPDEESEAILHNHVAKGRRERRFPDGAMSLIALAAAQRRVQVRPQPQYGRGYGAGNPLSPLGWNALQNPQTWPGEE